MSKSDKKDKRVDVSDPKIRVPTQSLQEILEEELAEGFGEDDPVVQNLRRQIDTEERNASSEEMYGNAPIERE
jgi:hypothetical protein